VPTVGQELPDLRDYVRPTLRVRAIIENRITKENDVCHVAVT